MLADARRDAEQTLRVLAVTYHNEWKKTRDEPVAGFAAAVYQDYLDVFPNEPTAYEMRFFHAELRYALADFEGAGAEYEAVALRDVKAVDATPPGKPGKFFKDALENAVFAWDLVAKKLDETEKRAPTDPKKRIPLAPARQRLLAACDRYLKYQPKGEKWVEIAYKAANIHYRHNAFAEATDLFTRIALDHPSHELAGYSTNLVLDAYNLLGDWRNVNGWAKRFYANAALMKAHPALKDDLARVIEQSAFKIIQERETARDFEAAAEEYIAFSRDWPQSRLAPTALYNASVDYGRAHRLDRAMEVREQFLQRYPANELAPKSLYDNAEAYEAIADFGKAAELYERYFREWKRTSGAPRARKGKAAAGRGARPRVRGEEGERRHHQRGGVPRRPAGVGARGGGERGVPRDLAEGPRRAAHVPLPRRPVRPPRPALEGAEAARGVPAPVREGSGRVARDHPAHGRDLREGRQHAARARDVRRGAPLLQAEPEPGEGPRPRRSPRRRCTSTSSPTSSSTTASTSTSRRSSSRNSSR